MNSRNKTVNIDPDVVKEKKRELERERVLLESLPEELITPLSPSATETTRSECINLIRSEITNIVRSGLDDYQKGFADILLHFKKKAKQQATAHNQMVLKLEGQIDGISSRIERLECLSTTVQKNKIKREVHRVLEEMGLGKESAPEVIEKTEPAVGNSNTNIVANEPSETKLEKHRQEEMICKHDPRATEISASGTITESRLQPGNLTAPIFSETTIKPPIKEPLIVIPQRELTPREIQLAERRQFGANMLVYHKSPFTLHLNRHKDNFPKQLLPIPSISASSTYRPDKGGEIQSQP